MATSRKSTKKSNPTVDATLVLVLNDENEADDELVEAVEALAEQFDGLVVVPAAVLSDDEDGDDGDEDGDDDDAIDGDDEPWDEDALNELANDEIKTIAEELEIELTGRFSKAKAIAAILAAQESDDDDEGDDESGGDDSLVSLGEAADDGDDDAAEELSALASDVELDPNDYDTWVELASAIEDATNGDDDDDDDDEDGVEELDEDALNDMSPAELNKVYEEVVGEKPKRGMKKDAKIEAIFEAAEAE